MESVVRFATVDRFRGGRPLGRVGGRGSDAFIAELIALDKHFRGRKAPGTRFHLLIT
jgi:hypothetical protein